MYLYLYLYFFIHLYLQKLFTFLPPLLCLTELSAPCFAENTSELRSASLTFLFPLTPPLLAQFIPRFVQIAKCFLFKFQHVFVQIAKLFLSKFQNVSVFFFNHSPPPHKPPLLGVKQNIAPLFTQFTLIISNHLHSSNFWGDRISGVLLAP